MIIIDETVPRKKQMSLPERWRRENDLMIVTFVTACAILALLVLLFGPHVVLGILFGIVGIVIGWRVVMAFWRVIKEYFE
jgi:hypothetical protein